MGDLNKWRKVVVGSTTTTTTRLVKIVTSDLFLVQSMKNVVGGFSSWGGVHFFLMGG
jgi:hypothetical protein